MSKRKKLWLIAAICLILLGGVLFVGVMTVLKWEFNVLSTTQYEEKHHRITDAVHSISIIADTADITFVPSEDETGSVVCLEESSMRHAVAVTDGTLTVEITDTRAWYEHIGIHFGTPKITLRLPRGDYDALCIRSHTGDIQIPDDFHFAHIDIEQSTGDVTSNASATDTVKIKTSTGDISIAHIHAAALDLSTTTGGVSAADVTLTEDISVNVSTGKTELREVTCRRLRSSGSSGDILLHRVIVEETVSIERSTGDVTLEQCDADELLIETDTGDVTLEQCNADEFLIETDTGDVTGSLLSDMVFVTHTDTGRVSVPNSVTGGRCEITTDTGDIKIAVVGKQ